jgi:hypothetical protein
MKQVDINNATYTEIHAGQTLARTKPNVDIILADVPSPPAANVTANVASGTAIYLPVGKATFARANTTNTTLNIIE